MTTPVLTPTPTTRLRIDFLFLDLDSCTRCQGAGRNLESALESAREFLRATGTDVEFNGVHVESAEQARELRFVSSPTIRVNGRDIALELRESSCGSEACTDGCGKSIACRVWVYAGEEHTAPPVAMILDAILGALDGAAAAEFEAPAEPFELPENLERFFAGRAAAGPAPEAPSGCCPPAEQESCCDAEDKAECCVASAGESCGCR